MVHCRWLTNPIPLVIFATCLCSLFVLGAEECEESEEYAYKPGAQVINAILANMWPSMSNSLLREAKNNPVLADPYLLKITSGKFRYAPTIRNIELLPAINETAGTIAWVDGDATEPSRSDEVITVGPAPRFRCAIVYKGRPGLDLVLTGADQYPVRKKKQAKVVGLFKRVLRKIVPDVYIEIKKVDLHAHVQVQLDMHNKKLEFFFTERPHVDWDLEFHLTQAHIPLVGEDSLDIILTKALEAIDENKPVRVKF